MVEEAIEATQGAESPQGAKRGMDRPSGRPEVVEGGKVSWPSVGPELHQALE